MKSLYVSLLIIACCNTVIRRLASCWWLVLVYVWLKVGSEKKEKGKERKMK